MKLQQTDLPNFKYLYEKEPLCNEKVVLCGFALCRLHRILFENVFWNNLEYRKVCMQMHFYYISVHIETNLVAVLFS
jgi:DNA-binding XRE family transcriptional regulator